MTRQPDFARCVQCGKFATARLPATCACGGEPTAVPLGSTSGDAARTEPPKALTLTVSAALHDRLKAWASSRNLSIEEAARRAVVAMLDAPAERQPLRRSARRASDSGDSR